MDVRSKQTYNFSSFEHIADVQRARNMLSEAFSIDSPMVKTASTDGGEINGEIVKAVVESLSSMGIKANIDIGELIRKLCTSAMTKEAGQKDTSAQNTVKIASKKIKDSHYDIDIAKDMIVSDGKSIIMVSAYVKEAYLGRYLIKRNYYFTSDNENDAEYIYNDLITKAKRTRDRYYSEKIGTKGIFPEVKAFLDGVKGDLELEPTSLGTTVVREDTRGHEVGGSPYAASVDR